MKAQNVDFFNFLCVSIKLITEETWSIVLLFLRKPLCLSVTLSLSSTHIDKRPLITEQYILLIDGASAMPLYDSGSLGSMEDDFGIGSTIHFPHIVGTVPLLKDTLNKMCKK